MSMKEKLQSIGVVLRASASFIKTLVSPLDQVESRCARGHGLLPTWDSCPHCQIIHRAEDQRRRKFLADSKAPRLGLYGLQGAHRGQCFLISGERALISCHANADLVLTPQGTGHREEFQVLINGSIRISGSENHVLLLNGEPHQQATLFDYDEIEILNNRFLVLDLRSEKGVRHDS